MHRAAITPAPLSVEAVLQAVEGPGAGAVTTFVGLVRDHNQGRHEHFEGGEVRIEGATADATDEAAREAAMRIACA